MDASDANGTVMHCDELLKYAPYGLPQEEKNPLFMQAIWESLAHHYLHCFLYKRLCDKQGIHPPFESLTLDQIPFLPSTLFKRLELSSLGEMQGARIIHSSATSSNQPSKVFLDSVTRSRQVKSLIQILAHHLGNKRRPFIVMDLDPAESASERTLSARGAAVRGFLTAASKSFYCMEEDATGELSINIEKLVCQLSEVLESGEKPVLLGYTYVLYEYVAKVLAHAGKSFKLPEGTQILHLGGWKKLKDRAVDKSIFNDQLSHVFGISPSAILDAYGFTEQLGVVYIDSADSPKRCPVASEIIIRDTQTFEPVEDGQVGFVEFITPLPNSYPGIAVLLEDLGRIISRKPSWRGEHGVTFEIIGRSQTQEVRGCGDILSEQLAVFR